MLISRVPLIEFYRNLLPSARMAGYKLVLTALVREADAPAFYEDVKRYWTSLHDATGPDILFVFAGANAAEELNEHGIRHGREPVAFRSDQVALAGLNEKRWHMHWRGQFMPQSFPDMANAEPAFRRGTPHLDDSRNLGRDHTLEIRELRRFLGLREEQLPCLAFVLPRLDDDHVRPTIVLPLTQLHGSTIYTYLKGLSERLEDAFDQITRIKQDIADLEMEAARNEGPLRKLSELRRTVRHEAQRLKSPEAQSAAIQILSMTGAAGRLPEDRSRCFELFQGVRREHPIQHGIIPRLQRLIDQSFLAKLRHFSFDDGDRYPGEDDLRDKIGSLTEGEREAWSTLEMSLRTLSATPLRSKTPEQWDFFIAYSSADRSVAEYAFSKLSALGRVFLDSMCLLPGDRWTERIRRAHSNSRCSILIITKDSASGWFSESEFLHAINLQREGEHIIIPILYGKDASLPYGLEQIHAASLEDWRDLERLPELVQHVLKATA
jgi:TIR domain